MNKFLKVLMSPVLMAFLLVLLIVSLGTATFIENDFGAEVARMKVYNSKWLEFILLLLSINLIGRVFQKKLYKIQKFSIFLFHIALIVMIIGAAVTRYFGYEGSMHIREGNSSSTLVTGKKIVSVNLDNSLVYEFDANIEQNQSFKGKIKDNLFSYNIELSSFYNYAYPKAVEDIKGEPIVGIVIAGNSYRGSTYLRNGAYRNYGDLSIAFNSNQQADINLYSINDSVFMQSDKPIFEAAMGGETGKMWVNEKINITHKTLYKINNANLVLQEFIPKGKLIAVPTEIKNHKQASTAMVFTVSNKEDKTEITLWGNDQEYNWNKLNDHAIGIKYAYKNIELPFSIYLNDFVIDRYPGSMSPSSFSSFVTLNEENNEAIPFHIYMNNILKHRGFRFYQSSYDKDEKGTILSVNNDKWGTMISYLGYLLLAIGMLWSMINKNSFFRKTVIRNSKSSLLFLSVVIASSTHVSANIQHSNNPHQTAPAQTNSIQKHELQTLPEDFVPIDEKQAEAFGKLLIQNNAGRTEPIYTYASEIMRKISRKEEILGLSPVQLFMEMNMNPELWINLPIIRVSNKELQQHLGLSGKYAAYTDFISNQSGYLLQNLIQSSFAKSPADRSKFDKAIMKTDEKVNICYAIFSGRYMKVLPTIGKTDDTKWYPPLEASLKANSFEDSIFAANILTLYFDEVEKAKTSNDFTQANEYLNGLTKYQKAHAGYELPSETKTEIEVAYYKHNPFKKLFPFYTTIGVVFLFILIGIIVAGKSVPGWSKWTFFTILLLGFIIHSLGIAARWYISGHAPMSNGYESMIFISWVTLLAGFLFHKRSPFALPATAALGGLTLMVANLSFMDPQITNLVPVLQSYWLTIHVSVITASYGFLGLGALIGVINLLLIILRTKKNHIHIIETLESLTIINHKTLIAGLYLLTIGTFLGAVWANESWGRYWGWDPKETWALISILVYTIVTHARLIPGLKGIFIFNSLALFGFSSILMTYFGVNYYLSGLHSYAGGDPVPVPVFVYYAVAAVILLTLTASVKYQKMLNSK